MTWDELADQLAEELTRIDESNGSRKDKEQAYVRFQERVKELGLRIPTILQKDH